MYIFFKLLNGQCLKIKNMTLEETINAMIEKCRIKCNDALHLLLNHHDLVAKSYDFLSQTASAVEHYRTGLSLMEKYKDKLIIDTIQVKFA